MEFISETKFHIRAQDHNSKTRNLWIIFFTVLKLSQKIQKETSTIYKGFSNARNLCKNCFTPYYLKTRVF